jgi:hypothetical protein
LLYLFLFQLDVTFFNFITTLFNQVATVPSVIVSLSRGMVTTTPSELQAL